MARLGAALRLLWSLTKRDLRSLSTIGFNNLFFCMIFLLVGGSSKQGFQSTFLFQLVLLVPMMFAMGADALGRIPRAREALLPLDGHSRVMLRVAGVAMNPAFWMVGGAMALWGGVAAGIAYVGMAVLAQALVLVGSVTPRLPAVGRLPLLPGRLGGIAAVGLRQLMRTLDFWAALLLCVGGTAYRWLAPAPEPEAFPIVAMLVAIALSTVAQRMLGQERAGSMARYRLLPLAGW